MGLHNLGQISSHRLKNQIDLLVFFAKYNKNYKMTIGILGGTALEIMSRRELGR